MAKFKRFYSTQSSNYIAGKFAYPHLLTYVYLANTPPLQTAEYLSDLSLITLTNFKKSSGGDPVFRADPSFVSGLTTVKMGRGISNYPPTTFIPEPLVTVANGGTVGPFRYIIFCYTYASTSTSYSNPFNRPIAYFDYGFSRSLANGQTMTLSCPSDIIYTIE